VYFVCSTVGLKLNRKNKTINTEFFNNSATKNTNSYKWNSEKNNFKGLLQLLSAQNVYIWYYVTRLKINLF